MVSCETRPGNDDICRYNLNFTICGPNLPICKILSPVATETAVSIPGDLSSGSEAVDNGTGMVVGIVIAGLLTICGMFVLSKHFSNCRRNPLFQNCPQEKQALWSE